MTDLIYPNLFLFLYDLRQGLGESKEDLEKNRKIFASKLPEHLHNSLFKLDGVIETEYLELLTQRIEYFRDEIPDEGYYYPVRLNDTYGLLIAASFPNNKTRHSTNSIAELKNQIEAKLKDSSGKIQTGNLGQTWLVLAELANNKNPEEIAKQCCEKLNLGFDWEKDLQGQGKLLGGTIFELRQYGITMSENIDFSSPPTIEEIQTNNHLIISLYPNEQTAKKAAEFNFDLLRLLCYRHKVFWAYAQSRYLKELLKKSAIEIQQYIQEIQKYQNPSLNLKPLQKILVKSQTTLYNYSIKLGYFDSQIRTIEINLLNYQRRLDTIREKATSKALENLLPENIPTPISQLSKLTINGEDISSILARLISTPGVTTDLKFIEKFPQEITEKYLLQMQKDYANLSPNLKLLEDLINSIRGITEIEQAESDRNFQELVAIIGVGLGAGASVASISGHFPYVNSSTTASHHPVGKFLSKYSVPEGWLAPGISIIFSLFASVIGIVGVKLWWYIAKKWEQRSR
ncbi:MAG: hypothetical protein F6K23_32645 [Okeania sp. SIO2C9]|uniref:hypothetical protein n=1 Tax=Okeania sp. SIO2C9 TaxID=2607791 RepID=UPI0013BF25B6|nr:hypothetical protein [Okeania sp. SIO2C9]NEQ77343.1 hypothetical protein [Okeania sp. SIO2C9]